jgi:prevent-host-death family protein
MLDWYFWPEYCDYMSKGKRRPRGQPGALTIPAAEFKARCLELVTSVREARAEYVITKHGRPVARLVPVDDKVPTLFGRLSGTVTYEGDLVSPLDVPWEALE